MKKFIPALLLVITIIMVGIFIFFNKAQTPNTTPTVTFIPVDNTPTMPPIVSTPTQTPLTLPKPIPLPPLPVGTDQFVVSLLATPEVIAENLATNEYIKDATTFTTLIGTKIITPGAYKISKEMTPEQLLQVLHNKPYMKWVVIPPGLRKEEIATLLTPALGWTTKQKTEWITKSTATKPEYIEGVYAPDTYLIPVGEKPADTATRLISKFNEGFAFYLPQFTAKNIKWTSALTLASIVQREASNASDMPLIAGILWNRLNQSITLGVDATLQYIRGNIGAGWWAPITITDKKADSPYNTYIHTGLPPHPISNPGLSAIDAVLNPKATDCLYYLHDKNHITHCATTYTEHQANIELYLKAPTQ